MQEKEIKKLNTLCIDTFHSQMKVGKQFLGSMNAASLFYPKYSMQWNLFERLYFYMLQGAEVRINRHGWIQSVTITES